MTFEQGHARYLWHLLIHQCEVQGTDEVALAVGQAIGTVVGQQTGATARYGFHVGFAADGIGYAVGSLDVTRYCSYSQSFGTETYVAVHQVVILPYGSQQQSADEGHTDELYEQQTAFPRTLAVCVTAEYLGYGNPGIDTSRHYTGHNEKQQYCSQRNVECLSCEKIGQTASQQFFHLFAQQP